MPSTTRNDSDWLIALQDQNGHLNWGDALLDLTGKTKEEWTSMRPKFVRCDDLWITAIGIVFLMLEDNTEAATLKARGYLSRHLKEKKVAKLIEKAFLKLKPLVPGLEGKEQLFMRQRAETPNWRQGLGEMVLRASFQAVLSNLVDFLFDL